MNLQQSIWPAVRWIWSIRGFFLAAYCLSFLFYVLFIGFVHHEETQSGRPSLISNVEAYPLGHEIREEDPYGFSIRATIPYLIHGPPHILHTFPEYLLALFVPYLIARWIGHRRVRRAGADGPESPGKVERSRGWWRRNRRLFVIALGVAVAISAAKVIYLHNWHQSPWTSIYANYNWTPPHSDAFRNHGHDLNLAFAARSLALDVVLIYLPTLGLVAPFYGALTPAGRRGRPGAGDAQRPTSDRA